MKLKSYFSATVEAAMDLARRELGEEALLVNARPATPETRYLGAYEVVFGLVPPEQVNAPSSISSEDSLRQEMAELRRQIDKLTFSTAEKQAPQNAIQQPPANSQPRMVEQLARGSQPVTPVRTDAYLGRREAPRPIVALVGPPGAGKTTTLIKLAARYGLARRQPTQILTADVQRIAAADQLRTLAAILGIRCEVCPTPLALVQQLEERHSKELLLIDTPGFSFREMDDARELAGVLASHPEIDTHLVLSASMKASDMSRVIDSYAGFQPSKLIFTHVDETARHGALVREASHCGLPVSFLCTGQQIPEDVEEATVRRLMDLASGVDQSLTELRRMGASA